MALGSAFTRITCENRSQGEGCLTLRIFPRNTLQFPSVSRKERSGGGWRTAHGQKLDTLEGEFPASRPSKTCDMSFAEIGQLGLYFLNIEGL